MGKRLLEEDDAMKTVPREDHKEFKMMTIFPEYRKDFSFEVTHNFVERMMAGTGDYRVRWGVFSPLDVPRIPSPGSTTVKCSLCGNPTEITFGQIVKELEKLTGGSG